MNTTINLYSLSYRQTKTYIIVFLFIAGNILFPMLFHAIPQGGKIFLPIYFFTLLGAYKYGLKPGLLIAVLSPIANHFLTGMPPIAVLPDILVKSCLLASAAAFAAKHYQKLSIPILAGVILFYQLGGTLFEWLLSGSFYTATQDLRLALPGMLIQLFGVYLLIKYVLKK
ncbi:ECF transporter S component [Bacteroidales bacterium OttesenSCG-928-B11]|nr:ECF transporter S component [Bacteroidales bacterium OttesenSCG-928-E04]MDL2308713.1 ECF transporter S component [Bacteroidales bacterium OttesenSCG-928-C03]MDL2311932.1 ECF transporter S component [Bacteroidales bacterium OttesenSCG-928-B11]